MSSTDRNLSLPIRVGRQQIPDRLTVDGGGQKVSNGYPLTAPSEEETVGDRRA